jgi:DsrE/DsrF-like family
MKALQIVTAAYRCNVEEQDDPVLWISQAMRNAGAELHVLLAEDAVNYAVRGQDASGLSFGGKTQTQPARIEEDLKRLASRGVEVHFVEEDAAERGLEPGDLLPGLRGTSRAGLPRLFAAYDQVWRW